MNVREESERIERATLHPRAARAGETRGRPTPEEPCPVRTDFQRDRDRILHSKAFRRLKHKTQVFLAPRGDHYRTRLTHTLEVAQIARTIARGLRLNEDLTEAVALGHDLGHTPFGHAGEQSLREIVPGGFSHVEQSVRVVERLEGEGRGLNLTREVVEGIRAHSKGLGEIVPAAGERAGTLEAQVVRLADLIAYINHDIDDAIRAGVITPDDLPESVLERVGRTHGDRIGTMVGDIIGEVARGGHAHVAMSPEIEESCAALREFLYRKVYFHPRTHAEFLKASKILRDLYEHYLAHPGEMGPEYARVAEEEGTARSVCDFLAGMTDRFVVQTYERLFLPLPWHVL